MLWFQTSLISKEHIIKIFLLAITDNNLDGDILVQEVVAVHQWVVSSIALNRNHLATSLLSEAVGSSTLQLERNSQTENTELLLSLVRTGKPGKLFSPGGLYLILKTKREMLCFLVTYSCAFSST